MTEPKYARHTPLLLKNHPTLREAWLQERIAEDPAILGLGDLSLVDRERRQPRAGRLDLLLSDEDGAVRYEVELMLGATDESHIIRCIEYWDIERRRYPGHDHVAVLVAEDIASRFLNILSLFAGTIPLVVIQLSALEVGGHLVLNFVKVIDQRDLRVDDEAETSAATADRAFWEQRSTPKIIAIADEILAIINGKASSPQEFRYSRAHIGLMNGGRVRNFVYFRPRKQFLQLFAEAPDPLKWVERFEGEDLVAVTRRHRIRVTLRPGDLDRHRAIVTELLNAAVDHQES